MNLKKKPKQGLGGLAVFMPNLKVVCLDFNGPFSYTPRKKNKLKTQGVTDTSEGKQLTLGYIKFETRSLFVSKCDHVYSAFFSI